MIDFVLPCFIGSPLVLQQLLFAKSVMKITGHPLIARKLSVRKSVQINLTTLMIPLMNLAVESSPSKLIKTRLRIVKETFVTFLAKMMLPQQSIRLSVRMENGTFLRLPKRRASNVLLRMLRLLFAGNKQSVLEISALELHFESKFLTYNLPTF